ncbi:MAG: carboxypeptidase-like regulatory domain-containing protein, partial [Acidobacteriaceae bacterium]
MYRTDMLKRTFPLSQCVANLLTLVLVAGLSNAYCHGQAGRGAISGTVTDSTNALVGGASVSLTATATNTVRTMTTGSSGLYTFSALVPGTYDLTVQDAGFDKSINQAILVEADRVTTVDVHLSPGQQTQTVNVSATETPLLNTTDSTVSTEIDNKTIESVPLNGRDLFFLAQLSASVIPANGSLNSTGEFNRPGLGISAFRINGLQEGSLTYILDGSPLTVLGYGTSSSSPAFTPALDSTQEFRLETNNSPATAPSSGSGVMSLVSKSGTDIFHGSAFFFERPNSLDANDPFNKAAQLEADTANTPPPFQRKQWGGSVGGPIRKDKLFFFGDYESTRASGVYTETTTVPTQAERTGDFSDVPTIYNPFNVDATGKRVPFSGNQIPASLQDAVALNMSKYYPSPNSAGEGQYHINNYFDASSYPDNADKFDVRLDYYLNSRQTIFGRYSFADTTFGAPDHFHNGADPGYYLNDTRGQNVLMAYNFTINPTTLLQVRYSFLRHAENQPPSPKLQST